MELGLSLKDFKQGMVVSRFPIEHAAPGSRWSGVSQNWRQEEKSEDAVGEHTRCKKDVFTKNAS